MSTFGVVLFYTTSAALKAEKALKAAGLEIKLIPTPRQLSSDCGMALRFDWPQAQAVEQALEAAAVEHAGVRKLES